jgi:TRAP-type C4-dicarboxylate transport system permease small subunit
MGHSQISSRSSGVKHLESLLSRSLEHLLTATFMFIFILVVLLVILRYLFNTTIVGGNEATVQLFIYTTVLGAAVGIARGEHITVDTFVNYLPARLRRRLDIFNLALVGTLNGFLLKYSIDWIRAVGGNEHAVTHLPEGLVQVAVPIGCALTVLFCVTRIIIKLADESAATN